MCNKKQLDKQCDPHVSFEFGTEPRLSRLKCDTNAWFLDFPCLGGRVIDSGIHCESFGLFLVKTYPVISTSWEIISVWINVPCARHAES